MISKVVEKMTEDGIRFINKSSPKKLEKMENGNILATWISKLEDGSEKEFSEEFKTVMMAVGRTPDLSKLNLDKVGVELKWKRVIVD